MIGLPQFKERLENREARLAVIGLGYVGLPVAAMFADVGFNVLGLEIKADRVQKINAGISPIEGHEPGLDDLLKKVVTAKKLHATYSYAELADRDVILIDVETPVDENRIPRYEALRSALKSLEPVLKPGALVIVESTIAPGTMSGVVLPHLQAGGKKLGRDFRLGNCPERVMPGKLLANLATLSRVVGGDSAETSDLMVALYHPIVQADLDPADWVTAELVKTVENAYRDTQIAFANEVALICEALGGDVWKVRELVNKSPYRQMHLPGAGVGGHCIPKDPWLLASGVEGKGLELRVVPTSRAVNDGMPRHMLELTRRALARHGRLLQGSCVLVLGYAYLENSDDTRNSPSQVLVKALQAAGAEVRIHDPFVAEYNSDLLKMAAGCDAAVLMAAHDPYRSLDLPALRSVMRTPILVDGRALFHDAPPTGFTYTCLGVG